MMWRFVRHLPVVAAVSLSTAWANPVSLSQAWQAARQHDPSFQAAVAEREAGQAERAIGRAGLLPQVSGTIGRSRMHGHIESPDARGNMVRQDLDYDSNTNDLSVRQMVFDWEAISAYRQGGAKAEMALATFDVHANENSERLINRYFQVLLANQQLHIAQKNVEATAKHVDIAQRYYQRGEGTITSVHEAQARHDMGQARLLSAQDGLVISRRELQEMIGSNPAQVYGLKTELDVEVLQPSYLEAWLNRAFERNAEIRAATQDVQVSALEIQRTFSGHLPSVHVVGSVRKVDGETLSTRNQEASTRSFGVQINVPIFSGGRTQAQVNQAQYNHERSQFEKAALQEQIAVEVTRQYQGVLSGAQHIKALSKAVSSNQQAITAAERGYLGGTASIRDILDAQDRLYGAELDLTKARLDYVLARLMLAAVTDGLDGGMIQQVSDTYFDPQPLQLL